MKSLDERIKIALKEAKIDDFNNIQLFDYQGILMDVIVKNGKIGFRVGNWFIPATNIPAEIQGDIYGKQSEKYRQEMTRKIINDVAKYANDFEKNVKSVVAKYGFRG